MLIKAPLKLRGTGSHAEGGVENRTMDLKPPTDEPQPPVRANGGHGPLMTRSRSAPT